MIEHLQAAGAAHVARDDRWIAGHVLAEMARDRARDLVDAAAGARADHQVERLAAVEVSDSISSRSARTRQRDQAEPQPAHRALSLQENAWIPVCARPRISAWISCVPS